MVTKQALYLDLAVIDVSPEIADFCQNLQGRNHIDKTRDTRRNGFPRCMERRQNNSRLCLTHRKAFGAAAVRDYLRHHAIHQRRRSAPSEKPETSSWKGWQRSLLGSAAKNPSPEATACRSTPRKCGWISAGVPAFLPKRLANSTTQRTDTRREIRWQAAGRAPREVAQQPPGRAALQADPAELSSAVAGLWAGTSQFSMLRPYEALGLWCCKNSTLRTPCRCLRTCRSPYPCANGRCHRSSGTAASRAAVRRHARASPRLATPRASSMGPPCQLRLSRPLTPNTTACSQTPVCASPWKQAENLVEAAKTPLALQPLL